MLYALQNVKKFLEDKKVDAQEAKEILGRAELLADNGILGGGSIEEVMGAEFAQAFKDAISKDPAHGVIGLAAMRSRG